MSTRTTDRTGVPATPLPHLDDGAMARLRANLDSIDYREGDLIFDYGHPADALYFVASGSVTCFETTPTGIERPLDTVRAGRCLGEVGLLHGGRRTASARALEPTTLLVVPAESFDRFLDDNPAAARFLLGTMAHRLSVSADLLREEPILNPNEVVSSELTRAERNVIEFVRFLSRFEFFALVVLVAAAWALFARFDPGLVGLSLALSLVQIGITNVVLYSQRRAAEREKVINDCEYRANLRADAEVRALHKKEDAHQSEVLRRLRRIEERLAGGHDE